MGGHGNHIWGAVPALTSRDPGCQTQGQVGSTPVLLGIVPSRSLTAFLLRKLEKLQNASFHREEKNRDNFLFSHTATPQLRAPQCTAPITLHYHWATPAVPTPCQAHAVNHWLCFPDLQGLVSYSHTSALTLMMSHFTPPHFCA